MILKVLNPKRQKIEGRLWQKIKQGRSVTFRAVPPYGWWDTLGARTITVPFSDPGATCNKSNLQHTTTSHSTKVMRPQTRQCLIFRSYFWLRNQQKLTWASGKQWKKLLFFIWITTNWMLSLPQLCLSTDCFKWERFGNKRKPDDVTLRYHTDFFQSQSISDIALVNAIANKMVFSYQINFNEVGLPIWPEAELSICEVKLLSYLIMTTDTIFQCSANRDIIQRFRRLIICLTI